MIIIQRLLVILKYSDLSNLIILIHVHTVNIEITEFLKTDLV